MRFNPRARAGRDAIGRAMTCAVTNVSIHAPARGATPVGLVYHGRGSRFNPRARAGRDAVMAALHRAGGCGFNPRARAGRDSRTSIAGCDCSASFNPRAPRGARPELAAMIAC